MAKQRIEYIDWLKGFSIICVTWFHMPHPDWLTFSFRMPLFFLLSGIFFKIVAPGEHIARKTNQLVIPCIFFYILFYLFTIFMISRGHAILYMNTVETATYIALHDPLTRHTETDCFINNPPLWFIPALLSVQIILYALVKILRKRIAVLAAAFLIAGVGIVWAEHTYTYMMFGRCLRFVGYYAFGFCFGKSLLNYIEGGRDNRIRLAAAGTALMALSAIFVFGRQSLLTEPATYIFNIALTVTLILLFRYVCRLRPLRFLHFFGRNSYVVLGVHYIYLILIEIIMYRFDMDIRTAWGLAVLLPVMLMLVPTILLFNRYVPFLVGKRELLRLAPLRSRPASR